MNILLTVELYNPHKGGAEKVIEDLAIGLVDRGHDVTVATTDLHGRDKVDLRGVKVESFKLDGNFSTGIKGSKHEVTRYQDLLVNGGFDLVLNYAAQSWPTDLTFPVLKRIKSAKVIAPVGYSRLDSSHYKEYFNKLPVYLGRYNRIVYHSSNYQDKEYGDFNGLAEKSVVIMNGADSMEFLGDYDADIKKKLGIENKKLLITVAHHNVNKGHKFVIKAFKRMKRNDSTLVIIGERVTSRGIRKLAHFLLDYLYCFYSSITNKNIRLMGGDDRDFVLSMYRAADLHLYGSKLECAPLVMYESFASKTPFITTDVGNVSDYKDYLKIADTPDDMAAIANSLLNNKGERYTLAERAFELWKENYVIEDIIGEYEALFKMLNRERT